MHKDHHNDIFTIGVGGAAGDGVREAGQSLGLLLTELGYEVFISNTYPSLIRGGHNFTRISFSKERVWCDHEKLDVLIALNEETVKLHREELHRGEASTNQQHHPGIILADSFDEEDRREFDDNAVVVPMTESVKQLKAPPITRNSVALGAACYLMSLDFVLMQKILADVFKGKMPEMNIKLADIGYEHLKKLKFRHTKKIEPAKQIKELVDGNTAFGKGLIAAGLDFYIGYPMTPVTGLLHYLAGEQRRSGANSHMVSSAMAHSTPAVLGINRDINSGGLSEASIRPLSSPTGKPLLTETLKKVLNNPDHSLKVIQPESELSVINMALGMVYAGKRVAVGSATGGFMLMQEALSFAGIAELPLVIAVAQRQAPATGVPTFSSQTDLLSVVHSGHGEFPRIVIAPGDAEEAFLAGATALNLAWKYQIPVLVLLDKILCEHSMGSKLDYYSVNIEKGKTASLEARPRDDEASPQRDIDYGRYAITSDGISPMAFPGIPGAVVKVTSYEHDEHGITADEAEPVKAMIDKRFRKGETLLQELAVEQTVKIYGDQESKNVVVFWGSTKGAVMEAAKYLKKPVRLVQVLWAEPFPVAAVTKALKGAKKILNIECNHDGQMASLIKEKTGIEITDKILKYDSRPLDPIVLAGEIDSIVTKLKIKK